jgi:hypothetical protein
MRRRVCHGFKLFFAASGGFNSGVRGQGLDIACRSHFCQDQNLAFDFFGLKLQMSNIGSISMRF